MSVTTVIAFEKDGIVLRNIINFSVTGIRIEPLPISRTETITKDRREAVHFLKQIFKIL